MSDASLQRRARVPESIYFNVYTTRAGEYALSTTAGIMMHLQ